jgi:uncharacterized protein YegP (UPF0339 family)
MSARVEIYREDIAQTILATMSGGSDRIRRWRWRFVSSNGRILADSGQGYSRRIDALNGCATVLGALIDQNSPSDQWLRRWGRDGTKIIPVVDLTREVAS